MVYGIFSPSVLGMMSQSQALNTIGTNIANVSTGGYKGYDTRFSTLVGRSMYHESDLSGVRPWAYQRIDQQGLLQASASMMDLGINGRGFFVLSDTFDGGGHTFYGRDGSFQMHTVNDVSVTADDGSTITVRDGYLADKNGYFVMGWEADANGAFPTTGGNLQPLRIDSYAFADNFVPTSTGVLGVNLPAAAATGSRESYTVSMVDSAGTQQAVTLAFRKSHLANQWLMTPETNGIATAQVDTVTLSGTPEAGDVYSVTINGSIVSHTAAQTGTVTLAGTVEAGDAYSITVNGTPFSYAAAGGETLADIRDILLAQIDATFGPTISATADGANGIALTSNTAFTLAASGVNGGGTFDNTAVATTVTDTLSDIRDALIAEITGTPETDATVAVAAAGADGIMVTAKAAGTPFSLSGTTVDGGGTADNAIATTTTATVLSFDSKGGISTPSSVALALSFDGGATGAVTLDVAGMTQYAGGFMPVNYSRNGFAACNMEGFSFDENGLISGTFEDGTTRVLYKVPLAVFTNPNGLEERNGNVFAPTFESGPPEVVAAGIGGAGDFMPNSRELSNVDIAEEFAVMILTQNAYNSSAQVFKTIDEMITVARDLKR
ncbi:MAG: flagellar hook-basal body complex protein [Rhodospirillales bacterium]|jgi:flagellar hook protein FlgE|nr:flagellar hook-basal body complex protein [Rhodospirillales bacterium]